VANHVSESNGIHENSARPAAKRTDDVLRPRPMPWAYIGREEVQHFAAQQIDPKTGRRLTGAQRALYVNAYFCIPTNGPEAQKPENEREVTQARSKFAREVGCSERTVQRAYPVLERAGLIRFVPGGRAGPANVHTREWQRFTLPKAPRGHWRVLVPRAVRRQERRAAAEREKRSQRILKALEPHVDASRIGVAVQKITGTDVPGTIVHTETKSLPLPQPPYGGPVGSASPHEKAERGGAPPRKPPADENSKPAGALPRELPPDAAAELADRWNDRLRKAWKPPDSDPH
jgi:hypothetical protein